MRDLNNKGFALVETLIVSVFVMGIFTLVYTNYYPLIGEYEKRENYDNIESVYKTNIIKKFIKKNRKFSPITKVDAGVVLYPGSNKKLDDFCSDITDDQQTILVCKNLLNSLSVSSIVINYEYRIDHSTAKSFAKTNSDISNGMKEYIAYLPNYEKNQYEYNGRIIVEYKDVIDKEDKKNSYNVYKYATLGADLR